MIAATIVAALLQTSPATSADQQLIDAARTASVQFQDRNAAIRAGYRRLGPEIPEMGEHWINPIMIVESKFDPTRPPVLTYANINGRPTLTGVAYALAIRPGESPPPTGVSGTWHDHAASVGVELASGDHHRSVSGPRVVMLHVWAWVDNPDGPFADANWALPYVRLGVSVPDTVDALAARAAALSRGGVTYYADVLRSLSQMDFTEELNRAADAARGADTATLRRVWNELVDRVVERAPDGLKDKIRMALGQREHR